MTFSPKSTSYIIYLRVGVDPGVAVQRAAAEAWIRQRGGGRVDTYIESSTRPDHRPELGKALYRCRQHKATLLMARFGKLASAVPLLEQLQASGVPFKCLDESYVTSATVGTVLDIARQEARKRSRAAAKARGRGNPNVLEQVVEARAARDRKAAAANAPTAAVIAELRAAGASLGAIARELEARGIRTPRGRERWQPVQVQRLLGADPIQA